MSFTIVKVDGATVLARVPFSGSPGKILVPLTDVLESLEVPEVTLTELPRSRYDVSRV